MPGQFHFEKDQETGNTICVEGWLKKQDGNRKDDVAESKLQKNLSESVPGYDASHLIPYCFGGRGEDNLVLMPERINKSYVSAIEKEIGRHVDASPTEKGVYLKVSVTWGESSSVPFSVRHEAFVENVDGSMTKVHDSQTRTDKVPKQTLKQELTDKFDGVNQNTK